MLARALKTQPSYDVELLNLKANMPDYCGSLLLLSLGLNILGLSSRH